MAEFNIEVRVNPRPAQRGSSQVERSLNQLEQTADRVRNTVRNLFVFAGVSVGVGEIVRLSDAYTQLQNRLRVVTDSQQELTNVTNDLFQISQSTRASFESTTELYTRLAISSSELGVNQRQLLGFTESLNQAIILSGASAQEANAGLIQLTQGLASGVLRGDELRSVLEQLPVVADVIARQLGVTRGALRELGAQGRITANTIIDAFESAREEIAERFGRTIPTLAQSFVILRNSIIQTFGQIDQSVEATRSLSSVVILLADNMDIVARSVIGLATALSINLAGIAIPRAIGAIRALFVLLISNPLTAFAVGLTAIIGGLVGFSDRILLTQNSIVNLRDVFLSFITESRIALSGLVDLIDSVISSISPSFSAFFSSLSIDLRGILIVSAQTADDLVEIFFRAARAVITLWERLPSTINTVFVRAFNSASNTIEIFLNRTINAIERSRLGAFLGFSGEGVNIRLPQFELNDVSTIRDLAEAVSSTFNEALDLDSTEQFINRVIQRAETLAQMRIDDAGAAEEVQRQSIAQEQLVQAVLRAQQRLSDVITGLQREGELLRLNNRERQTQTELYRIQSNIVGRLIGQERERALALFEAQRDNIELQLRQNQLLREQASVLEDIRTPLTEYQTTLTALNSLLEQGRINQLEFNNALAGTELSQSLNQLRTDVDPTGQAGQLQSLQTQLSSRLLVIQQAQQARLISEQEALNLSLQANRAYNEAIMDLETNRQSAQLQAAQSTATSLAQITSGLVGEQNSAYQALFALSKGFAIADATVQISNAIAKAANTPFPANLAAISTVAAQTAGLISTIQSTNLPAFQNGGSFRVGGPGGTDSQLVAFRASPGEDVTIRTPGQQRSGNGNITFIQNIENRQSNNVSVQSTEPTVDDQGNVVIGIVVDALNRDANGITTQIRNIAQTRG